MTLERISLYGSIAGIPILAAAYLSALDSVRSYFNTGPTLTVWLGAFAVLAVIAALAANAIVHSRSLHQRTAFQGQQGNSAISSEAQSNAAGPNATQFADVSEFYRTYDNALLTETETNIRRLSDNYAPGADRERFLVRSFATVVMVSIFEIIWAQIYRSQLITLHELANRSLSAQEVKQHFDAAVTANQDFGERLRFDQWLAFLERWVLLLKVDNDRLELAPRGREFLKYLVNAAGHDENTRAF